MKLFAPLTEQGTFISSGTVTRQRTYDYPGSVTGRHPATGKRYFWTPTKLQLPTYSTMVESWSDMDSVPAVTTYAISQIPGGQETQIKYPDGGRYRT
jgi:hypothetical protein